MQGQRRPANTSHQHGALTWCSAAAGTSAAPEPPECKRVAPADSAVPFTDTSWLVPTTMQDELVGCDPCATSTDPLLLSSSKLPPCRRDMRQEERFYKSRVCPEHCKHEASAATDVRSRLLYDPHFTVIHLTLSLPILVTLLLLLLFLFSSTSVPLFALTRQLQLYTPPALSLSPVRARPARWQGGGVAGAAARSPVFSALAVRLAEHVPSEATFSTPNSFSHTLLHFFGISPLHLEVSPSTVISSVWCPSLPRRRPTAAVIAHCAGDSGVCVAGNSRSPTAASIPLATWDFRSCLKFPRPSKTRAGDASCVARLSPLSWRIISHTGGLFHCHADTGTPCQALLATSCCPALTGSAAVDKPVHALSTGIPYNEHHGCKGLARALNRFPVRCSAPAASLSFWSSVPFLRRKLVPLNEAHSEENNLHVQTPTINGYFSLVKLQLQQQVQQHQAELRSLLRGLLQMALQCLRSIWGVYFLGFSVLVLPLCASARPYLEVLNRVPLNDPYFLRSLNLPDDASPALFGLPFYDVQLPPLFSSSLPRDSSKPSVAGCDADARIVSASVTPLRPQTATTKRWSAHTAALEATIASAKVQRDSAASPTGSFDGGSDNLLEDRFSNGETVHLTSGPADAGLLRGWLIPAELQDSRKGIICAHGWLANRQACLPFLDIAYKVGLHKDHHILLFDSRNSGESSPVFFHAQTLEGREGQSPSFYKRRCWTIAGNGADQLGCQAAEDLLQAILYMRKTHGITTVSLYAQGVSALGAMVLLGEWRDSLEQELGITVDKVIFDSPICSARDALQTQPLASWLANSAAWLHGALIWALTKQSGRQLHRLRASRLLRTGKPYKLLIFSSREDTLAPWPSVRHEMLQLPEQDRPEYVLLYSVLSYNFIYVFPTGSHCDLARTHRRLYADVIESFYKSPSFTKSLWQKVTGVHALRGRPGVEIFTPRDFTAAAEAAEIEEHLQPSPRELPAAAASLLQSLSCVRFQNFSKDSNWT